MSHVPGTLSAGPAGPESWSVVVPVKPLPVAKTRLSPLPAEARAALALAMALDTVGAAVGCTSVGRVVVVTDDPRAAEAMTGLGALVVPDLPDAGLNPALAHGAWHATERWPGDGVAALAGDLPALTADALAAALGEAARHARAFVLDASGDGTVLLTARAGAPLEPEFGAGSARRHRHTGAAEVASTAVRLRRDVDTVDDLRAALALGCGPRTSEAAAAFGVV